MKLVVKNSGNLIFSRWQRRVTWRGFEESRTLISFRKGMEETARIGGKPGQSLTGKGK